MFWGWGTATRQKKLSDTQVVYNKYRYFQFIFMFRTTWNYNYILSTLTTDGWAHKDITKEEAVKLTGGDELMPNLWARYSLYLAILGIGLAILTSILDFQK